MKMVSATCALRINDEWLTSSLFSSPSIKIKSIEDIEKHTVNLRFCFRLHHYDINSL